jgi:hypothetical protein
MRAVVRDLGMFPLAFFRCAVRGGSLHNGCLLVYGSTSFANPAVTLARGVTETFSGIRPVDVLGFIAAQLIGAAAATGLFRRLIPALPSTAPDILVPQVVGKGQSMSTRPRALIRSLGFPDYRAPQRFGAPTSKDSSHHSQFIR